MRTGRVELPRDCSHTGLSRACLPVPSTSASCREWGGQGSNLGLRGFNPALEPCSATAPSERPGRDSNPRLRGCSPADAPLSYLAKAIPGEGFEPDSSLGSEPSVLPVRRSRSVEKPMSSRSRTQLQFPLSRRRRASRAVSPTRSPTADRALVEGRPRTPCGTVRVLPSSARVHPDSPSRTRTSDCLPPGRACRTTKATLGSPSSQHRVLRNRVRSRTVRSATRCSATTAA